MSRVHLNTNKPRVQRHRAFIFPSYLALTALAVIGLAIWSRRKPYYAADLKIVKRLQTIDSPAFKGFVRLLSLAGYPPQANFFGLAIVLILYKLGLKWEAKVESVIMIGGSSLFVIIAILVNRPRPSEDLVKVSSHIPWGSYPSGHAITLTSSLGFLGFLIYASSLPAIVRRASVALIASVILMIAPARIYSGEHWPSDVLAGYLIGFSWLGVGLRIYRRGKLTGALER